MGTRSIPEALPRPPSASFLSPLTGSNSVALCPDAVFAEVCVEMETIPLGP